MIDPDDPFPVMRPLVNTGQWETSVRLLGSPGLVDTLELLVRSLVALGEAWGCTMDVFGQPDADGLSTEHVFLVDIDGRVVWCTVSGTPQRSGGTLPDEVVDWLRAEGWVLVDPDDEESWWRLVCHVDADDLTAWIRKVVAAVDAALWPQTEQWTVCASAVPELGERLHLFAGSRNDLDPVPWCVNLPLVLGPERCAPVLWATGSPEARVVCLMGLHHLHDGACVLQHLNPG